VVHHLANACLDEQLGALVAGEQGDVDALHQLGTTTAAAAAAAAARRHSISATSIH
jgi:hypothetical protein